MIIYIIITEIFSFNRRPVLIMMKKINPKKIPGRLIKLKKELNKLNKKELEFLVHLGKLSTDFLGYPIATLSTNSTVADSQELEEDPGKMLLKGIYPGPGKELMENPASTGGMGLAALMGFDRFSENLGSTALASIALGGMFGMSLLPSTHIFGNHIASGITTGAITWPVYSEAKPLPWGDNLEGKNHFLSLGPFNKSPGDTLSALLSGYGRKLKRGERCACPGALPGFAGKYGFY